jgi:hypothetical protein
VFFFVNPSDDEEAQDPCSSADARFEAASLAHDMNSSSSIPTTPPKQVTRLTIQRTRCVSVDTLEMYEALVSTLVDGIRDANSKNDSKRCSLLGRWVVEIEQDVNRFRDAHISNAQFWKFTKAKK